jgi:LCP family protein required for cell wall assembly
MQSQGTERTRSGNDIVAGRSGRRSAESFPPADTPTDVPAPADPRHSRRMPKPASPGQRGGSSRRVAGQQTSQQNQPNQQAANGSTAPSTPRVAGLGRTPAPQPPSRQSPTGRAEAPRRGQPRADRLPPPPAQSGAQQSGAQQSGRQPAPSQWDTQPSTPRVEAPRSERLRPAPSGPLPVPGSTTGPQRNGRTPMGGTNGRMPMPPAADAGISNRLAPPDGAPSGPPSQQGMQPVGPGSSRPGMSPAGQSSRPGMSPAGRPVATAVAAPVQKPERRDEIDPTCLTTEMEPISEAVEQKRKVDATLARFSAVHDEMAEEERQRRSRRMKIMPWLAKDDDLEEALTSNGPVNPGSANEQQAAEEPKARPKVPLTRLQAKLNAKRGRSMLTAKIAAGVAAALVLVIGFYGWRSMTGGNGGGNGGSGIQEVAALDENSPAIMEGGKQYGDSNFLLVGTASRPGAAVSGAQATDTMLVLHIPADGSRVDVVSFPPNLQVNRPDCQQWNNQSNQASGDVPAQNGVKLSSVYGTGGPRCVTDTVQQLTGLRINHFVGVDTTGFGELVDSVQGGVQMCVKAPVKDAALGTIVGQSGPVTLSGTQALNFVQASQVQGDTQPADLSRIQRQQRFLAAVVRKLVQQQNLLMSATQLNSFLGTFTKATFGDNMGVDQLAKLAKSLQGLSVGRITFVTLPTTGTTAETLDSATSKQLFTAIIDNSAMPGEVQQAAGSTAAQQVTPQGIKLQVMNGMGTAAPNAASETATQLRGFGFTVNIIGDTQSPAAKTVVKYAAGQQAQAALVASSVPSATLQVDPTMGGAIQLILGADFNHKVLAPHAGGNPGAGTASEAPAGLSYVNASDTSCA